MPTELELLTPSEAALVANVTVRDVNRVIDERIVPERFYRLAGGRRLHAGACPLVQFYFHSARTLTADLRSLLIARLSDRLGDDMVCKPVARWRTTSRPGDWTVQDGILTVCLWSFAMETEARHAALAEAREAVTEDRAVLSGTPVLLGTRIPVHDVAASLAAGLSRDRIRAAYPDLDDRRIELARIYAEATPPRGRPRRPAILPPEAAPVAIRKIARRRSA